MNPYKIITLLLLAIVGFVNAQTPEITLGTYTTYADKKETTIYSYLIGGQRYVIFKNFGVPSTYRLMVFDAANNEVKDGEFTYPLGVFGNFYSENNFLPVNGKLMFFKEHQDKGAGKNTLLVQELNSNGSLGSKETELVSVPFEKLMNMGGFREAVSPNGELLVVLSDYPWVKDVAPKITITVFDKTFAKKWSKDYTLNEPTDKAPNYKLAIANNGTVYITKSRTANNAPLWLKAMAIGADGGELKAYDIKTADPHKISDYQMALNANNELVLAGCYNDDKGVVTFGDPKTSGTWNTTVNGKAEPQVRSAAFDKPIEMLQSTGLVMGNGVTYLTSEQIKTTRTTENTSTGISQNTEFLHNAALVTGIDADGSVRFNVPLAKNSKVMNWNFYSGVYYFMSGDKLMAVYGDAANKYNPQASMGSRLAVLVGISADGLMDAPAPIKDPSERGTDKHYYYPMYLATGQKISDKEIFILQGGGTGSHRAGTIKW